MKVTGRELKAYLLAGLFAVVASLGIGYTAATVMTDLQTTGTMTVGNTLTVSGVATFSDALTVTGVLDSTAGLRAPSIHLDAATDVVTSTPTVTGDIVRDASFIVYIATQTVTNDWQKIGTQS